MLAATSITAAVLASRPRSAVGARLARLAPRVRTPRLARLLLVTGDLAQSGLGWSETELVRAKLLANLGKLLADLLAKLRVTHGQLIQLDKVMPAFLESVPGREQLAIFRSLPCHLTRTFGVVPNAGFR